jgi:hypothetical protein
VPRTIVVSDTIDDRAVIEEFLVEQRSVTGPPRCGPRNEAAAGNWWSRHGRRR